MAVQTVEAAVGHLEAADAENPAVIPLDGEHEQRRLLGHPGQGEHVGKAVGERRRERAAVCLVVKAADHVPRGFEPPFSVRHDAVRLADGGDPAVEDHLAAVGLVAVDLKVQTAARRRAFVRARRGVEQDESTRAVRLQKVLPQRVDEPLLQGGEVRAVH